MRFKDGSGSGAVRRVDWLTLARRHPKRATWTLVASMAAFGLAVAFSLRGEEALSAAPFSTPLWLLAAAFFVAEWVAVHIHTRRGAHTLTFIEIPAVIGLATVGPLGYIVARFIGSGLAQVLKGQRRLKLAFNRTNSVFGSAIALLVVRNALTEAGASIGETRLWLAILAAVLAEAVVLGFTVTAVIAINDPERDVTAMLKSLVVAWATSLIAAIIGVTSLLVASINLWAIGPMIVLSAGGILSLRIYGRNVRRTQELTALYAFAEAFGEARSLDDVAQHGLYEITGRLRADEAVVLLSDGDRWFEARCSHEHNWSVRPVETGDEVVAKIGRSAHRLTERTSPLSRWVAGGHAFPSAIAAPLLVGDLVVGVLAVSGRQSPAPRFDDGDLQLLEAAGRQVGGSAARAVAEDRLREEIEDKQRLIRSKDQLIAAVSHELRTPLTSILGYASLLEESPEEFSPEMIGEMASVIAGESNDLSDIVDDLLTAARMDLGVLAIRRVEVDLVSLTTQVVASAADGPISLEVNEVSVISDPLRVRQVVRNLVSNAARYGGSKVAIAVGSDPGLAYIEVRDDGDGIGAADPESIFGAYVSAHDAGTQAGSVGLGLTLSRRLARLMGGDLTYRRVGRETIFRFELPAESEMSDPTVAQAS
ncbi:MAG: GAF domain-containing protein [Acidimicrobiia bacterium]|nr:GAF domain-containing protein [Acidimicrobiia bacterium]